MKLYLEGEHAKDLIALRSLGLTEIELEIDLNISGLALRLFVCFPSEKACQKLVVTGASGCGIARDEVEARLKACAECLEALHFLNPESPLLNAAVFRRSHSQIDPAKFLLHEDGHSRPSRPFKWWEVEDTQKREKANLPAQLIFGGRQFSPELQLRPERNSAGMALGPQGTGMAFQNGLYELIERDAVLGAWLTGRTLPRIAGEPKCLRIELEALQLAGVTTWFLDATSDLGLPTVCAFCAEKNKMPILLTAGSAARSTYEEAAEKALFEALQSRPALQRIVTQKGPSTEIDNIASLDGLTRALWWATQKDYSALPAWVHGGHEVPFEALNDVETNLESVLAEIKNRGWALYRADISFRALYDLKFEVCRVLCAELVPSFVNESSRPIRSVHYGSHANGVLDPHPFA